MLESWAGLFVIASSVYMIASLAGLFAEKSGTVNIAIDGMMIFGAFSYSAILISLDPSSSKPWIQYVALLIVPIVGAAIGMLLGLFTINFGADNIIAGTAINILAPALSIFLMEEALSTDRIAWIPYSDFKVFGRSGHIIIFLAIAIFITMVSWFVLTKTKFGLRVSASGENPNALAASGVSVVKVRYISIAISGALAALAGAFATGIFRSSFGGSVQGMGYIAIAILITGQWKIINVLMVSLIFSAFLALTYNYTGLGLDGIVPEEVFKMIQYIIPIIILIIFKSTGAPAALGKPYNKEQR